MIVVDFAKFKTDPVTIENFGGKTFVIEKIPWGVSLSVYDLVPIMEKMEKLESITKEEEGQILNMILEVLQLADKTVTMEWLKDELELPMFNELIRIILSKIATKKNEESGDDSAKST